MSELTMDINLGVNSSDLDKVVEGLGSKGDKAGKAFMESFMKSARANLNTSQSLLFKHNMFDPKLIGQFRALHDELNRIGKVKSFTEFEKQMAGFSNKVKLLNTDIKNMIPKDLKGDLFGQFDKMLNKYPDLFNQVSKGYKSASGDIKEFAQSVQYMQKAIQKPESAQLKTIEKHMGNINLLADKMNEKFTHGSSVSNLKRLREELSSMSKTLQINRIGQFDNSEMNQSTGDMVNRITTLKNSLKEIQNIKDPIQRGFAWNKATAEMAELNYQMSQVKTKHGEMSLALSRDQMAQRIATTFNNNAQAVKNFHAELEYARKNSNYTLSSGAKAYEYLKGFDPASKTADISTATKQMGIFNSAIKQAGVSGQSLGNIFSNNIQKFMQWFSVAQAVMYSIRLMKQMYTEIKSIDKAMTELKKVSSASGLEISQYFLKAATDALKYNATISDVITSTAEFSRLGYNLKESRTMSQAAVVYQNVGDGISASEASKSVISTMQAFNISAQDVIRIVDRFNEVGNKFAISSAGIGTALQKSAAALRIGNNSLDESIGLITAANKIVQNEEVVGTGIKTISMRLRSTANLTKRDIEELGEDAQDMEDTVTQLQGKILTLTNQKVNIMADENTFKSTFQILKEISGVFDELSDKSQAEILELIAGKRQAQVAGAILLNFADAEKAAQAAANSTGSAMAENKKQAESLGGVLTTLRASFQSFSSATLNTEVVKDFFKVLTGGLQILTQIGGALPIVGIGLSVFLAKAQSTAPLRLGLQSLFDTLKMGMTGTAITATSATASLGLFAGAILAIGAVVYIGKQLYDLARATEIAAENADKARLRSKEYGLEIENIEGQIAKTNDKLQELNELQKVSPNGQLSEEISLLQNKNKELDYELQLKQALKSTTDERARFESEKALTGRLNSRVLDNEYTQYQLDPNAVVLASNTPKRDKGMIGELQEEAEIIQKMQESYQNLIDARMALADTTGKTSSEIALNNERLKQNKDDIDRTKSALIEAKSQFVQNVEQVRNLTSSLDQNSTKSQEFKSAMDGIVGSVMNSITKQDELASVTDGSAQSTKQMADEVDNLASNTSSLNKAQDQRISSTEKIDQQIESSLNSYKTLQSVLDDLNKNHKLSGESMSVILKNYPDLMAFMNDEAKMYTAIQEAQNKEKANFQKAYHDKMMASESFYRETILGHVRMNSGLSKAYMDDLGKFRNLAEAKQAIEAQLISSLSQAWAAYYKNASVAFNASVGAVASKMRNLGLDPKQSSSEKGSIIARNMSKNAFASPVDKLKMASEAQAVKSEFLSAVNNAANSAAMQQMKALGTAFDEASKSFSSINPASFMKGIGGSGSRSKSGGDGGKSGSGSAKDAVLEEFQTLYADLKHKREMDIIGVNEYYTKLSDLDLKYLAGKDQYAKDHQGIVEELYKLEQTLADEKINTLKKNSDELKGLDRDTGNERIAIQQQIISMLKSQIDDGNAKGLSSESDYMQSKIRLHKEASEQLKQIQKELFEDALRDLDFQVQMLERQGASVVSIIGKISEAKNLVAQQLAQKLSSGMNFNDTGVQEDYRRLWSLQDQEKQRIEREAKTKFDTMRDQARAEDNFRKQREADDKKAQQRAQKEQEEAERRRKWEEDKARKEQQKQYDDQMKAYDKQSKELRKQLDLQNKTYDDQIAKLKEMQNAKKKAEDDEKKRQDYLKKVEQQRKSIAEARLSLEKARINLQLAKENAVVSMYKEGKGFQYVADVDSVRKAQEEYDKAQDAVKNVEKALADLNKEWVDSQKIVVDALEEQIKAIEKAKQSNNDAIQSQIDQIGVMKEALQQTIDAFREQANAQDEYKSRFDNQLNDMESGADRLSDIMTNIQNEQDEYVKGLIAQNESYWEKTLRNLEENVRRAQSITKQGFATPSLNSAFNDLDDFMTHYKNTGSTSGYSSSGGSNSSGGQYAWKTYDSSNNYLGTIYSNNPNRSGAGSDVYSVVAPNGKSYNNPNYSGSSGGYSSGSSNYNGSSGSSSSDSSGGWTYSSMYQFYWKYLSDGTIQIKNGPKVYPSEQNYSNLSRGYAQGGIVDFTNVATLHGSPSKVETIFNAHDGKKLYDLVHNTSDLKPVVLEGLLSKMKGLFNSSAMQAVKSGISLSIGDIVLHDVQNVNDLGNAIVSKLPSIILQEIRGV